MQKGTSSLWRPSDTLRIVCIFYHDTQLIFSHATLFSGIEYGCFPYLIPEKCIEDENQMYHVYHVTKYFM